MDSLHFREEVELENGKLQVKPVSGRMIGEVTVNEYDKAGNLLFSETTHNDITLPGSIFVLEQMFKKGSETYRFLHPNAFPTEYNSTNVITSKEYTEDGIGNTDWNAKILDANTIDNYISDEYTFGFMVGHGGETASSILAPTYEHNCLKDTGAVNSFLPFRVEPVVADNIPITDANRNPSDDGVDYYLKVTSGTKNYFYAKGFSTKPKIYTKWSDGSGEVTSSDIGYNVPILTYAEAMLEIDEDDIRDFFQPIQSEDCYINQLGLVAGKQVWTKDRQGLYYHDISSNTYTKEKPTGTIDVGGATIPAYEHTVQEGTDTPIPTMYRLDFNDVKLITTLNFKSKDLSNDENKLKFNYKIYCL